MGRLLLLVAGLAATALAGGGPGTVAAEDCDPTDGTGYIEGSFTTAEGERLDGVSVSYRVVDIERNATVAAANSTSGEYLVAVSADPTS